LEKGMIVVKIDLLRGDHKKKLTQIYQGIFTYYRFHEEELQEKIKILKEETLYQKMDDGKLKVLRFFSKSFYETQRRISTPLRELLAGVWGMECFAEILTRFSFT
jgi:hypothetical protein